jgi:hypothetical protein
MMRHLLLPVAAVLAFAACTSSTTPTSAFVQFRATSDRGPCGTTMTIRFLRDDVVLGEHEFRFPPGLHRNETPVFAVPPGTHVLGARVTSWGGNPLNGSGDWWPDTTVTLTRNQRLVHTLDVYCS